jgi:uncharacterized membrane protein (UPF0127 family)
VRGHRIGAEVVRRDDERARGLMFRSGLALDSGMLFIFDQDDTHRFWMKNTYIPLSIAFIDQQGAIANVLEMTPLDTTTPYRAARPVKFALEMNAGWFQSRGIKPGDTIFGIPKL